MLLHLMVASLLGAELDSDDPTSKQYGDTRDAASDDEYVDIIRNACAKLHQHRKVATNDGNLVLSNTSATYDMG